MNRSIAPFGQDRSLTGGIGCLTGRTYAQWPEYRAPCSIHLVRIWISRAVGVLPSLGGGIAAFRSWLWTRSRAAQSPGLPGTISRLPEGSSAGPVAVRRGAGSPCGLCRRARGRGSSNSRGSAGRRARSRSNGTDPASQRRPERGNTQTRRRLAAGASLPGACRAGGNSVIRPVAARGGSGNAIREISSFPTILTGPHPVEEVPRDALHAGVGAAGAGIDGAGERSQGVARALGPPNRAGVKDEIPSRARINRRRVRSFGPGARGLAAGDDLESRDIGAGRRAIPSRQDRGCRRPPSCRCRRRASDRACDRSSRRRRLRDRYCCAPIRVASLGPFLVKRASSGKPFSISSFSRRAISAHSLDDPVWAGRRARA